MNNKAKAIQTLYRANRITIEGVKRAVVDGVITENEYMLITGEPYIIEAFKENTGNIDTCENEVTE